MLHLLFNAKKMKKRATMSSQTVTRDIRRLKWRIKSYSDLYGDKYIKVTARDIEWRTRYYWTQYFLDRGFSITRHKADENDVDSIVIGW